MRRALFALLLVPAGCDADEDWRWGDPELSVRNAGGQAVRVELEDPDDKAFTVLPGERKVKDLLSYRIELRITRAADGLLLLEGDFDADDFDGDRLEITVIP